MRSDVSRSRQKMPTAAKLVGGFVMALCGYALAEIVVFRIDQLGTSVVNPFLFAIVGFCFGWSKVGVLASFGYTAAWSSGIASAITGAFTVVLLGAGIHVYRGMHYHAYRDVNELLTGFIGKVLEYFSYLTDPYIIGSVAFAGLLAGVFTGFAARLWR